MKLFDLLKSCSKEELREIYKAVHSPLLNGNKRVITLFEVLRKRHPKYQESQAFREKIFEKVFPEKPYHDYALRRLFSELTQIIEEFLLIQSYRKNEWKRDKQLLDIFDRRDLKKLQTAKLKQVHKQLDDIQYPDSEMLQTQYELKTAFYRNPMIGHHAKQPHIINAIDLLDQYYILEKNLLLTDLKVVERTVQEKRAAEIQQHLKPFSNLLNKENYPHIQTSNALLEMMDSEDTDFFNQVKNQFFEEADQFSATDQRTIFFRLINHCVYHFNKGTPDFGKALFELYKNGLEKGFLLNEKGFLSPGTFRNLVIIALRVGEIKWSHYFISNYQNILENPEILPLCKAYIAMEEKEYIEVVQLLSAENFSVLHDNLTARVMVARAYFELSVKDEKFKSVLVYHLESFQVYLKRKKVTPIRYKQFSNFIRVFQKLIYLQTSISSNIVVIDKLLLEVTEDKFISSKNWLIELIIELKNRAQ